VSLGHIFERRFRVQPRKDRRIVSSEIKESVPSAQDLYPPNKTFADLGVSDELCAVLTSQGIITAFPIQAMTIHDALAGRDVCGKAKTGSGKTLGFGLPMLQRIAAGQNNPVTEVDPRDRGGLVLLPTREFGCPSPRSPRTTRGRARASRQRSLRGADIERQIKSLRRGCDVIIATPGRLIDLGDRGELNVEQLDVLVLDEADRMADMGFMPQVEWVLRRIANIPTRRCCSRRRWTARSIAW